LRAISFSRFINKTPLQLALQQDNLGQRIEENIANFFYWLSVLVVIYIMVAILGLSSATLVLEKILGYIPNVISAMFILLFGILVAGWVESLVKGAVRAIDQGTSRMLGKISGYFVVVLTSMTALSELGIAEEFLMIMFVGLVATLTLGIGLAVGLGGKTLVEQVLADWYENFSGKKKSKKK
jgi:small-conductance mechanosensitive channel